MAYLSDTSILFRQVNVQDPLHSLAVNAVTTLLQRQERVCLTPQNFIEFRNGATRPAQNNGLGMSAADAEAAAFALQQAYEMLPEIPAIYPAWQNLVQSAGTIGKQVHDVRLVAVCHVYGISHILTFNVAHFLPYRNFGPGLTVVHPKDV